MKQKLILGGGGSQAGQGIVSVTDTAVDYTSAAATTYSWGVQSIGAAPTTGQRRYIVVVDHGNRNGATRTHVETRIDGTPMDTEVRTYQGTTRITAISWLEWPTGTTASFETQYGTGTLGMAGIGIYSVITGTLGLFFIDFMRTTTDGGSDSALFNHGYWVNGGCVIAGMVVTNNGIVGNTISGTSGCTLSEDYEVDMDTTDWATGASTDTITGSGLTTVTVQWDNDEASSQLISGSAALFGHLV